jgi:hypothetical protein
VDDVPLAEGRVITAASGVLTVSFKGNLGLLPWSNLFVYRRGRVIERVSLKQLHETIVVFQFSAEEVENISSGDFAGIEEDGNILIPENFQGRIVQFRRQGFATIELAEASFVSRPPGVSVYRDGELLLEAVPERVVSIAAVAELQVGADTRIMNSDTVRIEK